MGGREGWNQKQACYIKLNPMESNGLNLAGYIWRQGVCVTPQIHPHQG